MLRNLGLILMQFQVRLFSIYYVPGPSATYMTCPVFAASLWGRYNNVPCLQMRKLRVIWVIWFK